MHASAYIDRSSVIIGDVHIGEDSSVWPMCVIRGDVHHIRIGARTNIQDGSVLHVMRDEWALIIGDEVTVGHSVTLHGCTIESRCLIGMGAIILNGAVVGSGSIVAAGALIPERTVIPPGSLVMGAPGKVKRTLLDSDQASIRDYAQRYVEYKNIYQRRSGEWRVTSGEKICGEHSEGAALQRAAGLAALHDPGQARLPAHCAFHIRTSVSDLVSSMCRSAVSIPSSIAKGQARHETHDFANAVVLCRRLFGRDWKRMLLLSRGTRILQDRKTLRNFLKRLTNCNA